jgi:hypothetical protein
MEKREAGISKLENLSLKERRIIVGIDVGTIFTTVTWADTSRVSVKILEPFTLDWTNL